MAKDVTKEQLAKTIDDLGMSMEELATAIEQISRSMVALANTRLRGSTVLLLVSRKSGVAQRDVQRVLEALPELERHFLKPKHHGSNHT